MAFDGITIAALTHELDEKLRGGHIRKIAQPEPDELVISIQSPAVKDEAGETVRARETYRLKLSANASLPLLYLTEESKQSPLTAPNFCMLLRKHLSGARVERIEQTGLERVVSIYLSNLNDMGDEIHPVLNIELMGKHSNIIFLDENKIIIDSIKHVNGLVSSIREVLPGREYFIPNTLEKMDPSEVTTESWNEMIFKKPTTVANAISGSIVGFSKVQAYELSYIAGVDGDAPIASINGNERSKIMDAYRELMDAIKTKSFEPCIYYESDMPREFSAVPLTMYADLEKIDFASISEAIENFYSEKDKKTRIKNKASDLTNTVKTHHDRCVKKLELLRKQLKDTEKRDKFKIYGELVTTYGYELKIPDEHADEDMKLICTNHYTGEEVSIPIDPKLSVADNANKYFDKYNKLKRTYAAVSEQVKEAEDELTHLDSVLNELDIARTEDDLTAIRAELYESGYIRSGIGKNERKYMTSRPGGSKGPSKRSGKQSGANAKSLPLHYISSDGYDIYVGKNNYQNEEITFHLATGNDWWFHAKQMPGSHVVVRAGDTEPPISTFEEAAALAAHFSKGKGADKLEIDYTQKKNVKKPGGGKPGFVVYYTNYSMMASANDIKRVRGAEKEDEQFL